MNKPHAVSNEEMRINTVKSYIIVSSRQYYIKDLTKLYNQARLVLDIAINRTNHNDLAHAGAYSHCELVFYPTRGVPLWVPSN